MGTTATATTTNKENKMGRTPFQPLPNGEYLVRMNKITESLSKTGKKMLKVSYQVVKKVGDTDNESKSKNRLIFETFIVDGSGGKAEEISKERISKYLKAVGVENGLAGIGSDLSVLANEYTELPFIAEVTVKDDGKGFGPRNIIKSYKRR